MIKGSHIRSFTIVFGYERVQDSEVKTQSSFSRRGEGCMLDQVIFFALKRNLMKTQKTNGFNKKERFIDITP
jgi:hypothetical protein